MKPARGEVGSREEGGLLNERSHLCCGPCKLLTYSEFVMSDNTPRIMFICATEAEWKREREKERVRERSSEMGVLGC